MPSESRHSADREPRVSADRQLARRLMPMLEQIVGEDCLGAGLGISQPGREDLLLCAGIADRNQQRPLTASHCFQAGSQAKTYIGAAVLTLLKRGVIDLGEPVTDYVEEAHVLGAKSPITIRQLLHHTSGVGDFSFFLGRGQIPWPLPVLDDHDVLQLAAAHGSRFRPGSDWQYSNTGYFLLGMMLERISGQSVAEFIHENFLAPLGLQRTWFASGDASSDVMAAGYFEARSADGPAVVDASRIADMSWARHAGDLVTNLGDGLAWIAALGRGDSRIEVSLDDLTATCVDLRDYESRYPMRPRFYGFGVSSPIIAGRRCWGHSGGTFGYASGTYFEKGSEIGLSYFFTYVHGDSAEQEAVLERHKTAILNVALALALDDSTSL